MIFVPGMRPKPEHEAYRQALCRVLTAALGRVRPDVTWPRGELSNCLTLISWNYRFYDLHRDIALDLPGIERLIQNPEPSAEDYREIDALARRLARLWRLLGDALPLAGRMIAKPDLQRLMAEAARYQRNEDGIGTEIRAMVKSAIRQAWARDEPLLLIGHSLGSVIAYDALWELSHADGGAGLGQIDLFVTLGSPLGSRYIRRMLAGHSDTGRARFPLVIRRWENFAARADTTAFRPALAGRYADMVTLGLTETITDHIGLYNHFHGDTGLNPHEVYGYLNNRIVAERIAAWLDRVGAAPAP
jgi:hypothetical protein